MTVNLFLSLIKSRNNNLLRSNFFYYAKKLLQSNHATGRYYLVLV